MLKAIVKATAPTAIAGACALGAQSLACSKLPVTQRRVGAMALVATALVAQELGYAALPQNRVVRTLRLLNRVSAIGLPMSALTVDEQFEIGMRLGEFIAKKLG